MRINMLQETIIYNISKLPEFYQQEILDYSDFLLSRVNKSKDVSAKSRGGFGTRKNDYIMADDFDEPLKDFEEYMQ